MKRAILLAAGAAVGYVLGAKAGRERYDQIVDQMNRLWHDPKVRNKAEQASSFVSEKMPTGGSGGSGESSSKPASSTAAGSTSGLDGGAGATDTGSTGGLDGGAGATGSSGAGSGSG